MRPVTKEEFYTKVGPLNVHASIQPGPWPYTAVWKIQAADYRTIGKSVDRLEHPGKCVTDYYLA